MLVKDVMNTNVRTVKKDDAAFEIASIMCLYRINGFPVTDEETNLLGFIAEKDIIHYLFPSLEDIMENMATLDYDDMLDKYGTLRTVKVADLMQTKVITVPEDIHVLRATSIMVGNRFRRIPVAKDNKLVGILSLGDVHKAIFQKYNATNISE